MKAIALALLAGSALAVDVAPEFKADVDAWRAGRVERLQSPNGWLSLVGLHWLASGKQTVGSAKDNAIVLASGPAHLGTLEVDGTRVAFQLAEGVDAKIGQGAARRDDLKSDASGEPTVVAFGSANFIVIERSGKLALRVKDANAETRSHFVGLDYYDLNPKFRVEARFEPHKPGTTIPIATVIDTIEPMANPGALVFTVDGQEMRVEAVDEGDGQLFVIFGDKTNGKETYGAGRFVYAAPPAPGATTTVLDFNKAYNPPCVFTPYATCPLPPPENRLKVAVTAGEKKYRGATHSLRRSARGFQAAERRLALLQERGRPLAHVLRRHAHRERLRLELEADVLARFAAEHDRVEDPAQRVRRARRELIGDLLHFALELIGRDDAVHDAELQRARRRDVVAEQAQLDRRSATREAQQPLRAAEARDHAEVDLGLAELRVLARDAQMTRHRQLHPAAEREAADRRDHRFPEPLDLAHHLLAEARELERLHRRQRRELGDVRARDERLAARAGQHDDAHRVVGLGRVERDMQLRDRLAVQSVELVGTVDRDAAHRAVVVDQQIAEGHGRNPRGAKTRS